jgi:hypothetical protein
MEEKNSCVTTGEEGNIKMNLKEIGCESVDGDV